MRVDHFADIRDQSVGSNADLLAFRRIVSQSESAKIEQQKTASLIAEIEATVHLTGRDIAKAVAKHYGLTLRELREPRRWRYLSYARHHAMYLMWAHTKLSSTLISRTLGLKDHTSTIHGVRTHAERNNLPRDFEHRREGWGKRRGGGGDG